MGELDLVDDRAEEWSDTCMKDACFWGLKSWICKLDTAVSETEVVE